MENVQKFMKKVPAEITKFLNDQIEAIAFREYLSQVEDDIEYFKKHGTFKPVLQNDADTNTSNNGRKSKRTVLKECSNANVPQIKVERISEITSNPLEPVEEQDSLKENIKIEKPDMPPPQLPIKKIKRPNNASSTRSTRSKASKNKASEVISRDSDVVLQQKSVEIIKVTDSDEEDQVDTNDETDCIAKKVNNNEENGKEIKTRTTRTKTRPKEKKQVEENDKRSRSSSTDSEKATKPKRQIRQAKRKKSEETSEKETSTYEDAQSYSVNLDKSSKNGVDLRKPGLNETYVAEKDNNRPEKSNQTSVQEKDNVNTTVILEKPTITKLNGETPMTPVELKNIMTDDEDDNVTVTLTTKTNKTIKKGTKAIFSPFEGSPVKKRVEAFEKLGAEVSSEIPVRTTRTKTKAQAKYTEKELRLAEENLAAYVKEKKDTKLTPQLQSRYLTTVSQSAHKAAKPFANESLISTKSASALKASQQEFKERELKRREKETEAIRKREALLLIQTEEKKKKREEKQIKAQQMREALEKTKQKEREYAEKTKEEKYKQAIAEKQEKIKKQQEEAERRRLDAMRKAIGEKRKEEERRRLIEEQERCMQEKLKQDELKRALEEKRYAKHMEHKKKPRNQPVYLREEAPLLPTDDCYDSDNEKVSKTKIRPPAWMSRERMSTSLRTMQYIDKDVDAKFFVMNASPDLVDIFEAIDPRKLKRTSSAVWRAPPRFTLMPPPIEESSEENY